MHRYDTEEHVKNFIEQWMAQAGWHNLFIKSTEPRKEQADMFDVEEVLKLWAEHREEWDLNVYVYIANESLRNHYFSEWRGKGFHVIKK